MIKISVIMPIYNSEKYLFKMIESVLEQTFTDYELILVDDGSTDNSWDICRDYEQRDSRIRAFHTVNQGVSGARNYGMEQATGQFIRFVDADDLLPIESLAKMYEALISDKQADLVIGRYTSTRHYYQSTLEGSFTRDQMLQDFSKVIPSFFYGVPWNKLYRHDIITKHNIQFPRDIHWSEDFMFNMEYFKYCRKIVFVTDQVYQYEVYNNENSLTTKKRSYQEASTAEMQRFDAISELIHLCDVQNLMESVVYDYFRGSVHKNISELCRDRQLSFWQKYHILVEIIDQPVVQELFKNICNNSHFIFIRFLLRQVPNKNYRIIFGVYMVKEKIRSNILVSRWLAKHTISPEVTL